MYRCRWFIILLSVFCLFSCEVKRPKGVMSDSKMEEVLYDYHIAKAMGEQLPYSENYKRVLYIESALKSHGVTQADFDSSMVWFSTNPDVLSTIYEKVAARLKGERAALDHTIAMRSDTPKESEPGDSVSLWAWQKIYRLTGLPFNNKVTFKYPSDANFKLCDSFHWTVRFHFPKGSPGDVYAPVISMQLLLQNDSLISTSRRVFGNSVQTFNLTADSMAVKEVRGFVYYPSGPKSKMVILDKISLMRYRVQKDKTPAKSDSIAHAKKDSMPANAKEAPQTSQPVTSPVPESQIRRTEHDRIRAVPKRQLRKVENEAVKPAGSPTH